MPFDVAGNISAPSSRYDQARETIVRSVFAATPSRRAVLRAVGLGTALSLLHGLLPVDDLAAIAAEAKPVEKKELSIGFIAITCSAPLLVANQLGYFQDAGLDVELVRTPSWSVMRDRLTTSEYDAAHILSPMPLAMTLGAGSAATPTALALIQNNNGQAITLALTQRDNRDPRGWKGMRFAVPFRFSMQMLLLRSVLVEAGLDPEKDVEIREMPPPEMVTSLKGGVIDGFLGPDPFNQMAVYQGAGFIHQLSRDMWTGHPCCGFGVVRALIEQAPNTYLALTRAVARGAQHCQDHANRVAVSDIIANPKYLPQPKEVVQQVITGHFEDGLGNTRDVPDRIEFEPYPDQGFAIWMMTQMRRWKMIRDDADLTTVATAVFRSADAAGLLGTLGQRDCHNKKSFSVLGHDFDPTAPGSRT